MNSSKYNAFISYNRAVDGQLAPALEQGLKLFAKPTFRKRALEIFRDDASLAANPSVWASVENALSHSDFFILLASPEAARSEWVKKELSWWCANRPITQIIIVLTDGELIWDKVLNKFDSVLSTALPELLVDQIENEPRWVDVRWARNDIDISLSNPKFAYVIADIASPIHSVPKDELIGQDVREFQKLRFYRRIAITLLLILSTAAFGAAIVAFNQKNSAIRAQVVAEAAREQEQIARQQAEEQKDKAFKTLMQAIEELSSLSSSIVKNISKNRDIPISTRLTTLKSAEDAIWSFAEKNELQEVKRTVFTNALEKISAAYYHLGATDESMRAWERIVQLQRRLVEQNPDILGWKTALGAYLIKLSYHKQAANEFQQQLEIMEEAVDIYRQLLDVEYRKLDDSDPTVPEETFRKVVNDNYDRLSAELERLKRRYSR